MGRGRERSSAARVNWLLDIMSENPDLRTDQVYSELGRQQNEIGRNSEARAVRIISGLEFVAAVEKASQDEDEKLKIDYWVFFKGETNLGRIAVQVKTSTYRAEKAKKAARKNKEDKIVIACGAELGDMDIIRSFIAQLNHLRNIKFYSG